MKKILATILALVMALGLCTVGWADGSVEATGEDGTAAQYASLAEAVTAAKAGTTVKLLSDISVSGVINITKDLTLDLNGKTITVETQNGRPFDIISAVSFTVEANGGGMIIPTSNQNCYGLFKVSAAATLTLNGGTYKGDTNRGSAYIRPSAIGYTVNLNNVQAEFNKQFFYADGNGTGVSNVSKLNVSGGSYTSTATVSNDGEKFPVFIDKTGKAENYFEGVTIVTNGGLPLEQVAGKATIRNCNIEVKQPSEPAYIASALAVSYGGTMTISGGTYTSAGYGVYVYSSGGTIIVDGAPKVTAASAAVRADATANATAKIDIASGEFEGKVQTAGEGSKTISVTGGTFSEDVSTYATDNTAVAEVKSNGQTTYAVGSAAIAAAANSGADVTVTKAGPVNGVNSGVSIKVKDDVKGVTINDTPAAAGTTYTVPAKYYYTKPSTTTTPDTTTKGSPKTFDAGVGIYAVTAVLSVTGMAWTAKKRH